MKKLFYIMAFSAIILGSCSKANNVINSVTSSGNSFTINGDIFKNQPMNIVVAKAIDTFTTLTNSTGLTINGLASDSLTVSMDITFVGKSTVSNIPFASSSPIIVITIAPLTNPTAVRFYTSNVGTLSVANYGAVGTNITGTFSGSFSPTLGTSTGITITNGAFSVKRTN